MSVLSNISNIYGCPRCQLISRNQSIIKKCIKKHENNDRIKQENYKIKKFIEENYKNVFYKNWKKVSKDNLSILSSTVPAMEKAFASFGLNISINEIKIDFILSDEQKLCLHCNIHFVGSRTELNLKKLLNKNNINKKIFYDYLNRNYSFRERDLILSGSGSGINISDILSFMKINYIKKGFSNYNVYLDIKRKKYIYSALKELMDLNRLSILKKDEEARLLNLYYKYRVPALEISDIEYMKIKHEEESLTKRIHLLNEELIKTKSNKENRLHKLLVEDSANLPKVDSSFEFDESRQKYLKERFTEL